MSDEIRIVITGDSHGLVVASAKGGAALKGLGAEAHRQNTAGAALSAMWGRQRQTLGALTTGLKHATLGLGALGVAAGAFAIKEGLQFNEVIQSNTISIERLTGSAKVTHKVLKDLFDYTAHTPFHFEDILTAEKRMLAFGLSIEQSKRALHATGDAVATLGSGSSGLERISLALGQIMAIGTVQGRQLMRLTMAGIPATKILADKLHLTADEVKNIGKVGIDAKTGIDALISGMEDKFSGTAAKQAKTASGMLTTIEDYSQKAFGEMSKGLFHELEQWLPEVNHTAEQISKIWGRKDLTPEQKFHDSFQAIEKNLGPVLTDIEHKIGELHIGEHLQAAFQKAVPWVAKEAGQLGIHAAQAFGSAFMDASPLGRLVLAGWLLSKTGGLAAFRAYGAKAGTSFGSGMATTVAAESGGWRAALAGGLKQTVIGAALAAGIAFGPELIKSMQHSVTVDNIKLPKPMSGFEQFSEKLPTTKLIEGIFGDSFSKEDKALTDFANHAKDNFDKLQKAGDSAGLAQIAQQARDLAKAYPDAGDKLQQFATTVEQSIRGSAIPSFQAMHAAAGKNMSAILNQVAVSTDQIRGHLGADTAAGKDALSHNFELAAAAVKVSMDKGLISTKTGLKLIDQLMRKALAEYGITGKAASNYIAGRDTTGQVLTHPGLNAGVGTGSNQGTGAGKQPYGSGGGGNAKGAVYVGRKGERGRDTVPAVLNGQEAIVARGELVGVFNGDQQAELDQMAAERGYGDLAGFMNRKNRPHYMAKGGVIGPVNASPGLGVISGVVQAGLDRVRSGAQFRADQLHQALTAAPSGGVPGFTGKTPSGVGVFDGIEVAKWILPALEYARAHGWTGHITSGYRPGFDSHTASGTSEHQGTAYPHGAIDFGGFVDPAGLASKMAFLKALAGYKGPGFILPQGFRDDGHLSGTGHAKGVLLEAAAGLLASEASNDPNGEFTNWRKKHPVGTTLTTPKKKSTAKHKTGSSHASTGHHRAKKKPKGIDITPFDRIFPASTLKNPGEALTELQVRAIYENAGFTPGQALQFALISKGESGWHPGIINSADGGSGLGQDTPSAWGSEAIAYMNSLGGYAAMRNPVQSSLMDRWLFERSGFSPWKHTHYWDQAQKVDTSKVHSVLGKLGKPKTDGPGRPSLAGIKGKPPKKHKIVPLPKQLKALKSGKFPGLPDYTSTETMLTHLDSLLGNQQGNYGLITTPTLDQQLAEIDAELALHEGSGDHTGDRVGIGPALRYYLALVTGKGLPDTRAEQGLAQARIDELRYSWEARKGMLDHDSAERKQIQGGKHGWAARVATNTARIATLDDYLKKIRDSAVGHKLSDVGVRNRNWAEDHVKSLKAENARLEKTHPAPAGMGGLVGQLNKSIAESQRELKAIDGSTSKWTTGGGMVAPWKTRLDNASNKLGDLTTLQQSLTDDRVPAEDREIKRLHAERTDITGQQSTPATNTDLANLLKQQLTDALKGQALANSQFGVFSGFAPLMAARLVGSFAHGSDFIPRDGLAQVHRGETIVPNPQGPFQITARDMIGRGGTPNVEVHLHGDLGAMVDRHIIKHDDRIVRTVSERLGNRQRLITSAPGGAR